MKQGNVTLDINDYDKMVIVSTIAECNIEVSGDKLQVRFPLLSKSTIANIMKKYPDYMIDYWNNELILSFSKQVSNE